MGDKFVHGKVVKYNGPIKAVIFDWAGTVVDCGVLSPTATFRQIFQEENVPITEAEARGPMGIHKRDHIQAILSMRAVGERWVKEKGLPWGDEDVQRLYLKFNPIQVKSVVNYAKPITGVTECIGWLRGRGIVIGSCTGYNKVIVDALKPVASKHGYTPDCYVAADEVPEARPQPHMVWLNATRLNVSPIQAIVKGNYVGCSEEQLASLDPAHLNQRLTKAYDILKDSGAHYVIDGVADLAGVIEHIDKRLANGDKPSSTSIFQINNF